ncbi:MAG: MFS transporter [Proteobacteria bacterium]|nr:MFS transporter [Pseudomonadota bacterium]
MNEQRDSSPSGYRWTILFVFVLINTVLQMQWLTFAPIAREARVFYQVSPLQIDLLSMIFMGVFLVVCIPASYVIDTYGIRKGVGFGACLIGICSLLKGVFGDSYPAVVICQTGLAVAQPFVINAGTKIAGNWFPINERATAVGIATLSQFIGIIIAMILTPLLIKPNAEGIYQIQEMLFLYGMIALSGALILLIFLKERPVDIGNADSYEERFTVLEGFRHMTGIKDIRFILVLFFIGLGMFNAISTCIDQICQEKGLSIEQTGLVGGMMLIAGIIGAIILPIFSDKSRKRKRFIILGMICMTPGLVGLTVFSDYLLLVSSFIFGFFLLGASAPIGFQYAAEISYPSPESTSQGLILLTGQISGILFIVAMNMLGIALFMKIFIGLAVINIILTFLIDESPMILSNT